MFRFVRDNGEEWVECVYHNLNNAAWGEVIEKFQEFLQGCGYAFPDHFNMAEILEKAHEEVINKQLPLDLGDYT